MMKNFLAIFALICLSFTSSDAKAVRVEIDEYITASNGCRFHVTGWVNVSLGLTINHYNVDMEGPCGRFQFEGLVTSDESGATIKEARLYNFDTEQYEDVPFSPFLGSAVVELEKYSNE